MKEKIIKHKLKIKELKELLDEGFESEEKKEDEPDLE